MQYTLLIVLVAVVCVGQASSENYRPEFSSPELAKIASHGPWPSKLNEDAGNELSGLPWAEALGEKLFNDPMLSREQNLSCASCHRHDSGFTDNQPVAVGLQKHTRNTQGLLDIGAQRWFGWDGGTDSLWAAALRPMLSSVEMGGDIPQIASVLRKDALIAQTMRSQTGNTLAGIEDVELVVLAAKAMGAYTRTLRSAQTAFDRFRLSLEKQDKKAEAEYPAAARRGLKIFLGDANCQVCHFGPNFSNGEFHDTGRPFFTAVGQVDSGRYQGIQRVRSDQFNLLGKYNGTKIATELRKVKNVKLGQSNWGQWRTPSLRNLTLTAPYMHDGSLATLRDVVDAYADINPARLHANAESLLKPLELSDEQRNDLVAFLETLSP